MKGRPPKPYDLHILEGTAKPSVQGRPEQQVAAAGAPIPPANMSAEARQIWDTWLPHIAAWVRAADSLALASLCQWLAWLNYWTAQCNKSKRGGTVRAFNRVKVCSAECDKLMAAFGMRPTDRAKLRVTGGEKPKVPARQRA